MNNTALPQNILEKMETFQASKAVFLDWKGKYEDLRATASNQNEMAQAADLEAEQYGEELRGLVRDLVRAESGDKDTINAISGKKETAINLAAEHRAYAADLVAEAEAMKDNGVLLAQDYLSDRAKAIQSFVDSQFNEILGSIEGQILTAAKLKAWGYKVMQNNTGSGTITDTVFQDIGNYFKGKMAGFEIDKAADPTLSMLSEPANISPFSMNDFSNPLALVRIKNKQAKG
ncbi:hypothetical protein [Methylomagnum sp.]